MALVRTNNMNGTGADKEGDNDFEVYIKMTRLFVEFVLGITLLR
jgi:hypothetical protein